VAPEEIEAAEHTLMSMMDDTEFTLIRNLFQIRKS